MADIVGNEPFTDYANGALSRADLIALLGTLPERRGLCVDATCPECDFPEMSLQLRSLDGIDTPMFCCRICGFESLKRPKY